MRILQIINALTFGGAQFILLDLAREARIAGYQVIVVCFRDGPIGDTLRREGFTVHVLGERIFDIPAAINLIKLINSFKPDIIHSHLFRATMWARAVSLIAGKARLITSIHGSETDIFHNIEKLMSRLSDFLIFPSAYLSNWYTKHVRHLKAGESAIVYPGVNIRPAATAQHQPGKVCIGTLSRLHRVKGIDRLIYACGELRKQNIPFKLVIGGNGRQKSELTELAKQTGIEAHCSFVGEICDRDAFLKDLDIFVAPSRQEAFGIHICEAMERGLPIIGAGVGGIPELISHNESGLIFAPESKTELVDALKKMINDDNFRKTSGAESRKKVEQLFDRQIAIARHLEIYAGFLPKSRHLHFAISSAELGGGERLALGIMCAFKARNWEVSATCAGEPLAEAIRAAAIDCSTSNMRAGGLFFTLKMLRGLIINRPTMLNTHLNKASLTGSLLGKLLGIPTVSHVHGLNKESYYRYSDALVAVSKAVRDNLAGQQVADKKLVTIANCIASPALEAKTASQTPLNIVINAKLHKNKGHKWALQAIAKYINLLAPFRITIIGDGPERDNLTNLCKELKIQHLVTFTGFMNNPQELYHEVDVALLPSLGEGIPLSLLEAMRWGIPCIASKIGGIPEIITHNENGLLITPQNQQELIAAIKAMQNSAQYAKFSLNAIEHFKRLNNYENMIESLEHLFNKVIKQRI